MEYIIFDDNEKYTENMYCLKDYSSGMFISYVRKNYRLIKNATSYSLNKLKCIVIQGQHYHDAVSVSRNNDKLPKYIVMDVIPYKNKHNLLSKILDFL